MRRPRLTFLAVLAAASLVASAAVGVAANGEEEHIVIDAATVPVTIDGDTSDWADVEPTTITLEQIDLTNIPPDQAEEIEFSPVDPIDVQLRVANDADNIYVLFEVPAPFDFVADDHRFSPAIAVQWKIAPDAAVHMGSEEEDLFISTGIVDIWHWELDCAAGELSGGQGVAGGNDEACNFDDEYSTTPEKREDDGGGDEPNEAAENSLVGSWNHTGGEVGADGTWIFEMARPLQTGDPQDAQWDAGGVAELVLAWWDPNETLEGWTDAGHLTNSSTGWVQVNLN